jgi:hypothetical protein
MCVCVYTYLSTGVCFGGGVGVCEWGTSCNNTCTWLGLHNCGRKADQQLFGGSAEINLTYLAAGPPKPSSSREWALTDKTLNNPKRALSGRQWKGVKTILSCRYHVESFRNLHNNITLLLNSRALRFPYLLMGSLLPDRKGLSWSWQIFGK